MDGAPVRYFDQPGLLLGRQRSSQVDVSLNSIQHDVLCFAIGAIGGVYLRVSQIDGNSLERPSFPPRVHSQRDRSASPQGGKQKIVRRRTRICAACGRWLIGSQAM